MFFLSPSFIRCFKMFLLVHISYTQQWVSLQLFYMCIIYLDHVHLVTSLVPLPFQSCLFPFPTFFPSNLMSSSAILYFNKPRSFGPNKLRNLSGQLHSYLAIFIQQKQSFKTFLKIFQLYTFIVHDTRLQRTFSYKYILLIEHISPILPSSLPQHPSLLLDSQDSFSSTSISSVQV